MAMMIDRLVLWTIETGLITSLMAIALATWFLVVKQNLWFMWPNVVGNSLLASSVAKRARQMTNTMNLPM
ncbi:uncharacterized protein BJ212DRAFT_472404 [Suillus subaureus]|uniref:DUF6534 domain-containing protein n=1 Tax=Suillus subaureus TaxID=48587 RepID=A0A9P7JAQ4_9AGAM|nr:uncharacterized protein BJ212DRAFT_472404 [Suillus subaureus]KAG1812119.1 hypothetical protein BJ212DRAFT_472404 [Suillus subaureus]